MKLPILDLCYDEALEYLINYSSALWIANLNNTILYDIDWYIIWIKYNWVIKSGLFKEDCKITNVLNNMVWICADTENKKWWFWLIDINKKAIFIKKKIKYNSKNSDLYFKLILSYITKDLKALNDNIKAII